MKCRFSLRCAKYPPQPENLAVLQHIALNLLKQERSARSSVKTKRLRAGWDDSYLFKVLAS